MNNEALRIYAEDAEEVIRHLNTTALKSLSGSGSHPDQAIVEVRNVSRRFLDGAKQLAQQSAAALPLPPADEVLENLLKWAERAHKGPYHVEINGERRRWFMTHGGANVLRGLMSEYELNELTPEAADRTRATDTYMAAADPQTITALVKEVLNAHAATPTPASSVLVGEGAENPVRIVLEVLNDWLEENEATDFDEHDVAHFFGMLGTAGYSILPNALAARPAPLSLLGSGDAAVKEGGEHWLVAATLPSCEELEARRLLAQARMDFTDLANLANTATALLGTIDALRNAVLPADASTGGGAAEALAGLKTELGNLYATIFRDGGHRQIELDANTPDGTPALDRPRYAEAVRAYWELRRQAESCAAAPQHLVVGGATANFQPRVATWMQETFGPEVSADFQERGFRFGEEAIELLQANGTTKEDILKLVDYVYSRPVGELPQEVGGTMVTLAALCQAREIDLMDAATAEQARVESPEIRAKIQQKQEAKRARMIATPLPGITQCPLPPAGWFCTRGAGHLGPCAAHSLATLADEN